MFDLKKHMLFVLTILMVVALTACTLGEAAEPTATPIDLDAVKTSAAATAYVELTKIAAAAPPTSTETPVPSETPMQTPTNTLAAGTVLPAETSRIIGGSTAVPIPSFTPGSAGGAVGSPVPACKNSQYGGDITIPDGTVFKPWEKFTKAWNVKNTGICRWDEGFYFDAVSGPPSMGANQEPYRLKFPKDFVEPGGSVNIYIDMYAPGDPGEYVAHWHMYDDAGQPFGGDFTVVIKSSQIITQLFTPRPHVIMRRGFFCCYISCGRYIIRSGTSEYIRLRFL